MGIEQEGRQGIGEEGDGGPAMQWLGFEGPWDAGMYHSSRSIIPESREASPRADNLPQAQPLHD
jgi:hypothetical protein